MPRPSYHNNIRRIPAHSTALPEESAVPLKHYQRSANNAWNLLRYVERNIEQENVYAASYDRHLRRLSSMVLLTIVEAFERFLKEIAAECINHVANYIADDRLDVFSVKGNLLAAHFQEANVGRALCEAQTWCDCIQTNDRVRRILADPFDKDKGRFYVFPSQTQQPQALRGRFELMSVIWQLRHTIVHNAGVITQSDAQKFRLLTRLPVESPREFWPARTDVNTVKRFLDESVELMNQQIGIRLSELLTRLYAGDSSLFDPAEKAQSLASIFGVPINVAGTTCQPT